MVVKEKSKARIVSGYILLALSVLAWIAVPTVPFLASGLSEGATFVTGLIIVGEVTFFLALLVLGKDLVRKLKKLLSKLGKELKNPDGKREQYQSNDE